ncbi:hypothetical protein TPV1_gp04 [Thermococcus prieurii virus 1]|uniref:hypothetical protein n=1 Tax=Thermococcus prieurii virus 1 TaxID=1115696 RepID=UPI00024FB20A|nr:hypothetical protein TPV1_gp04 [Thermococcus prieurii virus 1]AEY69053.1 hypothetical protein [Thermococcus prieurii virus 1]AFA44816.1 hypothetical protein [Thermococcus prieurii virus 1]
MTTLKPWLGGSRPVLKHEGQHVVPINGPWLMAFDPPEVQIIAVGEFLVIWPPKFEYSPKEALKELTKATQEALNWLERRERA